MSETPQQNIEDQLREQLQSLLDIARGEIEQAIANASFTQRDGESDEQIAALEDQLRTLDSHGSQVLSGSLGQLQQLQTALPRAVSSIRQNTSRIVADASYLQGVHVTEMSMEQIHTLQRHHDELSAAFNTYETQSALRIDQLAAANGADISAYRMNRARIQADIEKAKQNGDRVGQFKGEALLAGNNVFGLVKAGADQDEIDQAKQKAAEMRAAYLKEAGVEAMNAGKAQGLTGDALTAYVDQATQTAARELDGENRRNAERAGLTPDQMVAAGVAVNAAATARLEERNALIAVSDQTEAFSIRSPVSQSTLAVDREEVASATADMKSILAANGITPPSVSTGFESCEVEVSTPKHPAAAPARTAPAQDGACIQ
ncbi:MAG: hypothetical protein MRY77_02270 [Rhodobacteraceae bacterium]|nr:hypothetical protein [Paracoccaceae bacterium]